MQVSFTPMFLRMLKALPPELREETFEKIEQFKNPRAHKLLKVHKLKGRLKGRFSFSIDYRTRVVFVYLKPQEAVLLAVGDHDVYNA